MTEDEMVGWHDQLNAHEFEQALGDGDGQGSLVWCSPWVTKSQTEVVTDGNLYTYYITHFLSNTIALLFPWQHEGWKC